MASEDSQYSFYNNYMVLLVSWKYNFPFTIDSWKRATRVLFEERKSYIFLYDIKVGE